MQPGEEGLMSWPPKEGELWMAAERWPTSPPVPGGAWVTILGGVTRFEAGTQTLWWRGKVLGPYGVTWIKAAEGDLIPGDDPRLCAIAG